MRYYIFKWMDVFKRMYTFYKHIDEHKANRLNAFINKSQLMGFAFVDEDSLNVLKQLIKEYVIGRVHTFTRIDDDIIFEHNINPEFLLEVFDFGEVISKVEYLCYCATYPHSESNAPSKGYHCVGKDLFGDMCVEENW